MNHSFNLLDEPWIPCTALDGSSRELSLRQLLAEAHTLRDLNGGSPLVTVALYRLLLAVLHRAHDGPKNRRQWDEMWKRGRWEMGALDDYFARWRDRFDLFHPERPFYQAADRRVRPKSVASLIQEFASGNNATLFDHHLDVNEVSLTPAQAAHALLASMAFGLAGLSGLPEKFTAAPCVGGVIFIVQGDNFFETLCLNSVNYSEDKPLSRSGDDAPAWEQTNPFQPERSLPNGYLDYLTWQNRRILLLPEVDGERTVVRQTTIAPGLRLDLSLLDPMKHYRATEKYGYRALRFSEDRALWRDSSAILPNAAGAGRQPAVVNWLAVLVGDEYLDQHKRGRLSGLGMASDQAKVEFVRADHMPLPLAYLPEDAKPVREALDSAVQAAEKAARQLWGAVRTLARYLASPDVDSGGTREPRREDLDQIMGQWDVERRYWSQLEAEFYVLMERLPDEREQALAAWTAFVRATALASFDSVSASLGSTPRVLKAWVHAGRQLAAGLAQDLPLQKEPANTAA